MNIKYSKNPIGVYIMNQSCSKYVNNNGIILQHLKIMSYNNGYNAVVNIYIKQKREMKKKKKKKKNANINQ